jgi:PatG C-terminal/Subtilase family
VDRSASATALDMVGLGPLMALTSGSADVGIGLVDGPVSLDHPDLVEARIRVVAAVDLACPPSSTGACAHGTFVAGILVGRRGSPAPSISPGCTLIVRPIFFDAADGRITPSASSADLAEAVVDCVDAGARIVNLSVATEQPTTRVEERLRRALDHAVGRGVIVVAAAGNQGTLGGSDIIRHAGVVPVVSFDRHARPMLESNVGASIGRRGVGAPGDSIVSLGTQGAPVIRAGTSVATAFVTGTIALLWSLFPEATAGDVRRALAEGPRRTSVIPPLLSATAARVALGRRSESLPRRPDDPYFPRVSEGIPPQGTSLVGVTDVDDAPTRTAPVPASPVAAATQQVALPVRSPGPVFPEMPTFVYALGRIDARYPTLAVEKEFAQAIGNYDSAGRTDREVVRDVIQERHNRYLARSLCWVLTVEGLETYILVPRDPADLDLLIDSYRTEPRPDDLDVVIGTRHGIAPQDMCNGLAVPVVGFTQIYSFDRTSLIESIPVPDDTSENDAGRFRTIAGGLFDDLNQLADNAGATDEHRALNYLTVRYPRIYTVAAEQLQDNFSFTGVQVFHSPLSGPRTIVDVVFSFTHRQTDVVEKRFVRVDVTEEFPFLHGGIARYFER